MTETIDFVDQPADATNQTITHADAHAAAIRAGLQQWLQEFVENATYIPDEGVTVELPGFEVPAAKVVHGDGDLIGLTSIPADEKDPVRVLASTMKA